MKENSRLRNRLREITPWGMPNANNVAIVVLNYNNANDTVACLRSLWTLATPPRAVVVVDNGSSDDSGARILAEMEKRGPVANIGPENLDVSPRAEERLFFLALSDNQGYAAGNNRGIELAKKLNGCEAFWILNNDVVVEEDSLDELCRRMNEKGAPAIVGSTVLFYHAPGIVQCAAGYASIPWLWSSEALLNGLSRDEALATPTEKVEERLTYVVGASFLIHREVIERLGAFRENFFLYEEEAELCVRAKKAGVPLLWARESVLHHKEGASTGKRSRGRGEKAFIPDCVAYLMRRNRFRLVLDHYPLAFPVFVAMYCVVVLRDALVRKIRPSLLVKAALDGMAGRMGRPDFLLSAPNKAEGPKS